MVEARLVVLRLRRGRAIAAILWIGVLHVHFRDPRKIIADQLHRVAASQGQMRGVGRKPDIPWICVCHDRTYFMLPLHRPPDMGMRSQSYAEGDRLPADFIQGVGQCLELILAWPTFG